MSTKRIVLLVSNLDIALLLNDVIRDQNAKLVGGQVVNGNWKLYIEREDEMVGLVTVNAAGVEIGRGPTVGASDLIEVEIPDDLNVGAGSHKDIIDWAKASITPVAGIGAIPTKADFLYGLNQPIQLALSGEKGAVTGRAQYLEEPTMYQVLYLSTAGEQRECWFRENLIEAQKQKTKTPTEVGDNR